jgi:hypothetical protein
MNKQLAPSESLACELIKEVALHPMSLAILVENFAKDHGLKQLLYSFLTSDQFLVQFAQAFTTLFSEEELHALLALYRNPLMKKLLVHSKTLFDPIYHALQLAGKEFLATQ